MFKKCAVCHAVGGGAKNKVGPELNGIIGRKVAAAPGFGGALFVGLPGNPMAAAVVLRQIALPAIRKMAGLARHETERFPAVAGFDCVKREGRTEFVPVRIMSRNEIGLPVLAALGRGSSGSLFPMAQADGLAVLAAEVSAVALGQLLSFDPF